MTNEELVELYKLLAKSTPIYDAPSEIREGENPQCGKVFVWHRDLPGTCVARFEDMPTALAFISIMKSAPGLIESARNFNGLFGELTQSYYENARNMMTLNTVTNELDRMQAVVQAARNLLGVFHDGSSRSCSNAMDNLEAALSDFDAKGGSK